MAHPGPFSGEERRNSVVIVYRRRPRPRVYIRDYPRSAWDPSPAQIDVRLRFARAASRVRGARWRGILPMPIAALAVRRELSGYSSPYKARRLPRWAEKLLAMAGGYGVSRSQLEAAVYRILAALQS